jgi:hypothetical protein
MRIIWGAQSIHYPLDTSTQKGQVTKKSKEFQREGGAGRPSQYARPLPVRSDGQTRSNSRLAGAAPPLSGIRASILFLTALPPFWC